MLANFFLSFSVQGLWPIKHKNTNIKCSRTHPKCLNTWIHKWSSMCVNNSQTHTINDPSKRPKTGCVYILYIYTKTMGQGPWARPVGRARALMFPAETSTKTRPVFLGCPFLRKSVQTTVNHRKIRPPRTRKRIRQIQRKWITAGRSDLGFYVRRGPRWQ